MYNTDTLVDIFPQNGIKILGGKTGFTDLADNYKFYSGYISSAQRLPNGNTLITEGADGRLLEVTPEHELVWEYMSPYFAAKGDTNHIYRSYRYPYDYIPQLDPPQQAAIPPIERSQFHVPGARIEPPRNVSVFEAGDAYNTEAQICNVADADKLDEGGD